MHINPHASRRAAHPHDETPLSILLVEDRVSDEALTREALRDTGMACQVKTLHRGSELLPYLKNKASARPDLILLDLGLPGMDGFDVLEQLSRHRTVLKHIPVVLLTGYSEFTYLRPDLPLPVLAFLTKPCAAEDLRDLLGGIRRQTAAHT